MTSITRYLSRTVCLFCLGGVIWAQTEKTSPPPGSASKTDTQEAQSADQAASYQFSVQVKRVIVDVVVTDNKGKPIAGLKPDDFKVLEDGVVQPIRSFDAQTPAPAGATQPKVDLHLPPNTFSNLTVAPPDKPVTILLYDMLNTPQSALPFAHQELVKFIKDQKRSTQIAIFALTDRLHMVQGFTDDETRLLQAMDARKTGSRVSQLRVADSTDDTAALLAPDPAANTNPTQTVIEPTSADAVLSLLTDAQKGEQEQLDSLRIQTTIDAFTTLARFVAAMPGRKNLIWMSGSFPVELWPGRKPGSAAAGDYNIASRFDNQIVATQQSLKDSRIAIYPVDVRGLRADPQYALSAAAAKLPAKVPITGGGPPPPPTFGVQDAGEHATMDAIAESTGGRAFYNTNGLQEAMEAAVHQGSEYYTLTYAPSNTREDGAERKIQVVLKEPNYHLYYRTRYLAADTVHGKKIQPLTLDMNMQHGAPNSSELFLEASVHPVGGPMTPSAAEFEALKSFLQNGASGKRTKAISATEKVQHYDINFAIIGRELEMPLTANGRYATDMHFGLAAYTDDGELLNGTEVDVKNTIPEAQHRKIVSDGYHASMVFAAPEEAASLRLAVRDEIGNRIGTLEVPLPLPAEKTLTSTPTTK